MTDILFISILICCGVCDAAAKKIPNIIPLLITLLAVLRLWQTPDARVTHIAGFFVLSVPLLIFRILRGGIGGGDIKLTAACGLYLGVTPLLYGTLLAALLALVARISLRIFTRRTPGEQQKNEPKEFAFGPFLVCGYVVAFFFLS